jgi:hypothetical protein
MICFTSDYKVRGIERMKLSEMVMGHAGNTAYDIRNRGLK